MEPNERKGVRSGRFFDSFRVRLSSLAPLVLRLVLGLGFTTHGWGKLVALNDGGNPLGAMVGDRWIVLPWMLAITEFFGGCCLVLGLLTRFWAAGMVVAMAVAIAARHQADLAGALHAIWSAWAGLLSGSATKFAEAMTTAGFRSAELAWVYLGGALALFLMGPGAFSLDHLAGLVIRGRYANAVVGMGLRYPAMSRRLAEQEEARASLDRTDGPPQ